MKNVLSIGVLISLLSLGVVFIAPAFGQDIPHIISYQGLLQNANGTAVLDSDYTITVHLFSDAQGTSEIWEDSYRIAVSNGVFNILLGSGSVALPEAAKMGQPLWIGTQIGNEPLMRPLTALAASPYALTIANNSITADKMATDYVGSISVNGQKVTGAGGNLNLIGTNGISLSVDSSTNSIYLSGSGNSGTNKGKGATPLDVTHFIVGTQNEVLANGYYGLANGQYDTVILTTPQAINTGATPQFANINLTSIPSGSSYTNVVVSNGGTLQTRTISSLEGSGVTSIHGTANQVITSDTMGSVTLSLPQSIANSSSPSFTNLTLSGKGTSTSTLSSDAGSTLTTKDYVDNGNAHAWSLTGNAGTAAGTNFIGTTDSTAFEIHVNNNTHSSNSGYQRGGRAMRFEPHLFGVNIIGGDSANYVRSGVSSATIAGGGGIAVYATGLYPNRVLANSGTVCGGNGNVSGDSTDGAAGFTVVAGGRDNWAKGNWAAIIGGDHNRAFGDESTVGGGAGDTAAGLLSSVVGGTVNYAGGIVTFIGGGSNNRATGNYSQIGGGGGNTASNSYSAVGGGQNNTASGDHSAISGGLNNIAIGPSSSIAAGNNNTTSYYGASFIGGGNHNIAGGYESSIVSGSYNSTGHEAFVGAGVDNSAGGVSSAIAGGDSNTIGTGGSGHGFIGAGRHNSSGSYAAVDGGYLNSASDYSSIAGGQNNSTTGAYSFVAGGHNIQIGTDDFGFNGDTSANRYTDLSYVQSMAYFGNADLWIGNVDGQARALRFYAPNTSGHYDYANYTSFKAPAMSSIVNYTLPASQGAANTLLANDGSGNLSWALSTATAWGLTGNTGTTAGTNFIGTTDSQAVEIRTFNNWRSSSTPYLRGGRVMRFESQPYGVNIIGGDTTNYVRAGVSGATIAGGGGIDPNYVIPVPNRVQDYFGTVGGGENNRTGDTVTNQYRQGFATVAGGADNYAKGIAASIGGGWSNRALGPSATIAGGTGNAATADFSTVSGGTTNLDSGTNSVIAGGSNNTIFGGANTDGSVISGGIQNSIRHNNSFIGGGYQNQNNGAASVIGGGLNNSATGGSAFIGGGTNNSAGYLGVVVGGDHNIANGSNFVGGGSMNNANGVYSVIVGGDSNNYGGYGNFTNSFIGGGHRNGAGNYAVGAGGAFNSASGDYSSVGGGRNNVTYNKYSAIPGGQNLGVGYNSFGFNGDTSSTRYTSFQFGQSMAYFGNVDIWIGNVDTQARSLKFYAPNSSTTFSGAYSTSFKAASQSSDITYILPASQGAANSILSNDGSGNLLWSGISSLGNIPESQVTSLTSDLNSKLSLSGGTMAGMIDMGTNAVTGMADPTSAQDAATKNYVDQAISSVQTTTSLTGDVTGTGSGTVPTTLASVGAAGTYTKVTTDAKGRVTSGTLLSAGDIPNLSSTYLATTGGTMTGSLAMGSNGISFGSGVNVNSMYLAGFTFLYLGTNGEDGGASLIINNGHWVAEQAKSGGSSTTTAAAGSDNSGGGASITSNSGDVAGEVDFTTGSSTAAGEQAVVTFHGSYHQPPIIILTAANDGAAADVGKGFYVIVNSSGASNYVSFSIKAHSALTASSTYKFFFHVLESGTP